MIACGRGEGEGEGEAFNKGENERGIDSKRAWRPGRGAQLG